MKNPAVVGILWIACAAMAWGTTGSTMRLLHPLSPLLVGFLRLAIAGVVLGSIALLTDRRRIGSLGNGCTLVVIGMALAAYQICFFSAVIATSIAFTALLAICTAPIVVAFLSRWILGDRLNARVGAAIVVGIIGVTLLIRGTGDVGVRPGGAAFVFGMLCAIAAAVAYAVVVVLSKHLLARMDALTIVGCAFPCGALFLAPVVWRLAPAWPTTATQWGLLGYLGVVPTAIAYLLYVRGLRTTTATVGCVISLLEPLTATMLGVCVFHEHLGAWGYVGAVLMLAALILVGWQPSETATQRPGALRRAADASVPISANQSSMSRT